MDGHFSGVIKPFEAIGWCQVQGRVDGSCQSHIISTCQKFFAFSYHCGSDLIFLLVI